jgi:hypothetical protein
MKKVIVLLVIACAVGAWAQDLEYFPTGVVSNPAGVVVMSGATENLGGLVQLIRTTAIVEPPVWTGNGLGAGETLTQYTWFGSLGSGDGLFYRAGSLASYQLGTSSSVYVRVYDRPTAGGGAMPTPFDYGSGNVGVYYRDSLLSVISTLPFDSFTTTYTFDIGSITAAVGGAQQWQFLAIPEPTSMALGLLGLGVIVIRRRLMRK